MERKIVDWKVKGMNRDLSVSAFNPEFSYENFNVRLSTNEYNTTMSWVNEKGTKKIAIRVLMYNKNGIAITVVDKEGNPVGIEGIPIGTAVLNSYLVLFTTKNSGEFTEDTEVPEYPDYIYRIEWKDRGDNPKMDAFILYNGCLNFSAKYPLETLVSYEAGHVQKVYWTDGLNQPRVINIQATKEKVLQWADKIRKQGKVDTFFDFVPGVRLSEKMTVVQRTTGGGIFAPGVIQYCFTYVNKYAQQTNIIQVSPLYYLTKGNRGASPEEYVTCNFTITIDNVDTNFDYIRIYSIQRVALDLDVQAKLLADIPISEDSVNGSVVYIDNGSTGSLVDPTELLYVGGREITAETLVDKDSTLFLGNLVEKHEIVDDIQEDILDKVEHAIIDVSFTNDDVNKTISNKIDNANNYYNYKSTLNNNNRVITTFKGGDTYRFGFQLQKTTGEWSQPIFIMDKDNPLYPKTGLYDDTIHLVSAKATIPIENINTEVYKRIRPVIVYPNIEDRNVLCQGVLNPTVFNVEDRIDKYPFAQASWYFRPYVVVPPDASIKNSTFSVNTAITIWDGAPLPSATTTDYSVLIMHVDHTKVAEADGWLAKGRVDAIRGVKNGIPIFGFITFEKSLVGDLVLLILIDQEVYEDYRAVISRNGLNDGFEFPQQLDISMINGILKTYKNELYYVQSPGMPDYFATVFRYNSISYCIKFLPVLDIETRSGTQHEGSNIPFTHYDSLIAQDDYLSSDGDDFIFNIPNSKRVEIQGMSKLYDAPDIEYTEENDKPVPPSKKEGIDTNSQFFVDQSIITLNSPDIDMDTQVQTYGTQGLKLRIIGAIPITANISSHRIINSSPMLEASHQEHEDGIKAGQELLWGSGELPINIGYTNISTKAGNRLVAEYLWNDSRIVYPDLNSNIEDIDTASSLDFFMVYPWHRSGSLNNDQRANNTAASNLEKKKESNLLFSHNTEYFSESYKIFNNVSSQITLTENAEVMNYKLPGQNQSGYLMDLSTSEINYYPNVDKLLYNTTGYRIIPLSSVIEGSTGDVPIAKDSTTFSTAPVQMKYKSTSHAVIALNTYDGPRGYYTKIPILPCCTESREYAADEGSEEDTEIRTIKFGEYKNAGKKVNTFWGDVISFEQDGISIDNLFKDPTGKHVSHNILWLGELCKDPVQKFGGTSKEALLANNWLPCGDIVDLTGDSVELNWTEGDTYYQRYDCLKTYAFTPDDPNQLVEILSFMCETHVNIDGRYDGKRGQLENHDIDPSVFNLVNSVYSQRDNFFNYKMIDTKDWNSNGLKYPNNFYWSKTKTMGERVDTWTNVTLASISNLDGDKGEITSLQKLGNNIIAFQDTGIAQILYNENAQIAPQIGVPIELANNGEVQGSRYISDTVGCSNKWSIVTTPSGIYFMDSNGKNIYMFNGQLTNISGGKGFNTWAKDNIKPKNIKWDSKGMNTFAAFYDKLNHDILFVDKDVALAFSESFNEFSSFYSYNNAPFFCNLDDTGIWIAKSASDNSGKYHLYEHRAGDYCNIFDANVPYSMKFVCNPDPALDKIFSNIEMRATAYDVDDKELGTHEPYLPFDNVIVENEYQYGATTLRGNSGINSMRHFLQDTDNTLKRKFRIWRCDVPRNQNVSTHGRYKMDRMRNPWVYLKLIKDAAEDDARLPRTEIHDVMMHYYI